MRREGEREREGKRMEREGGGERAWRISLDLTLRVTRRMNDSYHNLLCGHTKNKKTKTKCPIGRATDDQRH